MVTLFPADNHEYFFFYGIKNGKNEVMVVMVGLLVCEVGTMGNCMFVIVGISPFPAGQ